MSNFETITVERRGRVAILTINRPERSATVRFGWFNEMKLDRVFQ